MYINKITGRMYLILFLVLICLPGPIWLIAGNYIYSINNENRTFAAKPVFNISDYDAYSMVYTTYFNDNLPFKNKLTEMNSWVNYCFFKTSANDNVILGKQKWLFYGNINDGDPMGDYEGKNIFTDNQMQAIQEAAVNVQNRLAEMGIELTIIIPPNKERVYRQYMPEYYEYSENSRTDMLIGQLQQVNVNVINPRNELLDKQAQYPLYYSYDTHWNQLGAYVGTCEILKTWGVTTQDISEVTIVSQPLQGSYHICAEDDLAKLLNLRDSIFNDEIEYSIQESASIDWSEVTDDFMHIENPKAPENKKVFLLGDSYRMAMLPTLSMYFSDVYVVHRDYYTYSMLEQTTPDYLIIEYVERQSGLMDTLEQVVFEK